MSETERDTNWRMVCRTMIAWKEKASGPRAMRTSCKLKQQKPRMEIFKEGESRKEGEDSTQEKREEKENEEEEREQEHEHKCTNRT
eukprot:762739-Hanusia_phi.AAC.2